MKQLYVLLIILTISKLTNGQEFSFDMYFEDALGNRDTLTFGYDSSATDLIDTVFGEANIISIPLDTTFDVRISNAGFNLSSAPDTFHTKKQIVEKSCGQGFTVNSIDIFTDNWPVTATWDSTLFSDKCRNGSLITSMSRGGWFDTDGFVEQLSMINSKTFNPNLDFYYPGFAYVNDSGDTVDVIWQAFGDSSWFTISIYELGNKDDINVFPNPASDQITIETNQGISEIDLLDLTGKELFTRPSENIMDLTNIPNGLYFIRLTLHNGQTRMKKIIKNNARQQRL